MKNASGLKRLIGLLCVTLIFSGCLNERDRTAVRNAASQINASLEGGDFAKVYRESAPRFKTVGSESEFVLRMRSLQDKYGPLENVSELAYETGIDSNVGRTYVLISNLQYQHGQAREHLTFVRSNSGEMQLWKLDIQVD